ncbi:MAG: DUF6119 family protein [Candidatus Omnitrophota bacterium]
MRDSKLQISIYKIEDDHNVNEMVAALEKQGFEGQELEAREVEKYRIKLYYQLKPTNPKWKFFFNSIIKTNQKILEENKSRTEGFVLLLHNTDNDNLYAINGGCGYFAIQEYIQDDFGMDIFSRLINKDDKILKAAKEKLVVGGILGATKHFRNKFNLFEDSSFGKIYQEIKADINKSVLIDKMGFTVDDIKKDLVCVAKSSFRINKTISFDQVLNIVRGCELIMETEQPIMINNVVKINKKKNQRLIQQLEEELFSQLWHRWSGGQDSYSFDLCHKDFEKYLTAEKYIVRKGVSGKNFLKEYEFEILNNVDLFFDKIREANEEINGKDDFVKLIKSIRIFSYDGAGEGLTKNYLIAHLMGDVTLEEKKYFFIDNAWYYIKQSFVDELNEDCRSFILKNSCNGLVKTWEYDREDENKYSQKYIGDNNTIVLDKITPENIELCDILKWDENNLYLYHIKAGFGNTMRDLCSQIIIAANRLNRDLNSSREYVKVLYQALNNKIGGSEYFDKIGRQTERYSESDFVGLFDKKIIFVLAVLDTATDRSRLLCDVQKFNSSIAKFSLQNLAKSMKSIERDLKINQISKP